MKKLYFLLFTLMTVVTLTCCEKDEKGDLTGDSSTNEKSWAKLAETYPFLSAFPAYDGEIDIHNFNDSFGMEALSFLTTIVRRPISMPINQKSKQPDLPRRAP